jgi:ArsR family transcriptional regulator
VQSDLCVKFCRALADETRQKILVMLLDREMSVNQIVQVFEVSQPTISHHLSVLRQFGLLAGRKEGKQVYYRTNRDMVAECCGRLTVKLDAQEEL